MCLLMREPRNENLEDTVRKRGDATVGIDVRLDTDVETIRTVTAHPMGEAIGVSDIVARQVLRHRELDGSLFSGSQREGPCLYLIIRGRGRPVSGLEGSAKFNRERIDHG